MFFFYIIDLIEYKRNFPMNPHVRLLFGRLAGWSAIVS